MSFSNPRRTPMARDSDATNGLKLKTNGFQKGATFHSPTTPPASPPTFSRSQTTLEDVIGAHCRRAALAIGQVDDLLLSKKPEARSTRRSFRDNSLPVPRSFLDHALSSNTMTSPVSPEAEKGRRVLRPRSRRSPHHHESDSGLGTSMGSSTEKDKSAPSSPSAITGSITTPKAEDAPRLSARGISRIHEHTLKPLLGKRSLKDFRPIVLDCPKRIQDGRIVSLRDLEKTLFFMAPEKAKSVEQYLDFCLTSIRCIQATVEYLSDRDQTRPQDRPYSSGYFIDLVEQIHQHAQQLQEARERQAAGETLDDTAADPTDEVKLMGGMATNGRPAELVRVKKNGKAFSIATGQPFDEAEEDSKGPVRFKRSMSQQLEDDEEVMRSMARRKKNASPEELAPKKCREPGCSKLFKRPCDLTKHEKTHSRPWKCPFATCKYHNYGWPTEKEMDRHVNDKHSAAPPMHECQFKPCPYKSKRESNCKQHMEKAHGWTYVRTKTNGKKGDSKAGSECNPTPQLNNLPTPVSDHAHPSVMTPPRDNVYAYGGNGQLDFPTYPSTEEFNAVYTQGQPFDAEIRLDISPEEFSPSHSSPLSNGTPPPEAGQYTGYQDLSPEFTGQFEDIYGAPVQLPEHTMYNKAAVEAYDFAGNMCPQQVGVPHISPVGQGNTMLYTPTSMMDNEENFEDYQAVNGANAGARFEGDFQLFDSGSQTKQHNAFYQVTPSYAGGYSQPSSQDFALGYSQPMQWPAVNFTQSFTR